MVDLIATLIALVVYCGLSWLVTVGVIKLALARSVFKSRSNNK